MLENCCKLTVILTGNHVSCINLSMASINNTEFFIKLFKQDSIVTADDLVLHNTELSVVTVCITWLVGFIKWCCI